MAFAGDLADVVDANGVPAWAADYIGIPFARMGRTREGCDCWGLLNLIYAERLGGPLKPYEGNHWYDGAKASLIGPDAVRYASGFKRVPVETAKLGDGLLLRIRGFPIHVGLVLTDQFMIHTTDTAGVCIERYTSTLWKNRIVACYRRGEE